MRNIKKKFPSILGIQNNVDFEWSEAIYWFFSNYNPSSSF